MLVYKLCKILPIVDNQTLLQGHQECSLLVQQGSQLELIQPKLVFRLGLDSLELLSPEQHSRGRPSIGRLSLGLPSPGNLPGLPGLLGRPGSQQMPQLSALAQLEPWE